MKFNSKIKIKIITSNPRDTYLNLVLHNLELYFNLETKFIAPEALVMKDIYTNVDLIIFDETDINKIELQNLFFARTFSRFAKFIFLGKIINENIEERLYLASIDFIIRKNFVLTKPPANLIHCINTILQEKINFKYLTIGKYKINIYKKIVLLPNRVVKLSTKEFLIIILLFNNIGSYLTRDEIFKEVWGFEDNDSSRLVDHSISIIRKQLDSEFILNKYKKGYKINI